MDDEAMTVAELIAALKDLPQDLPVVVFYDSGYASGGLGEVQFTPGDDSVSLII